MLNNAQNQIFHIFLPLLVKLLAFVAGYTLLNLLFFHTIDIFDINDDIPNFYIPLFTVPIFTFIVTKQPFLVFEYDDKGGDKAFASRFIISVPLLITTCLTQYVASEKIAKISNFQNVDELRNSEQVKYYTFEDFYIDKEYPVVNTNFKVTGQYNSNFQMDIFVALPLTKSGEDSFGDNPYWYGIKYSNTVDNELSSEDKSRLFRKFYTESLAKFNKQNLYYVTYFERLKDYSEKDLFIEKHPFFNQDEKEKSIVFVPKSDSFEDRLSGLGTWWFISLSLTIVIVFLTTFIPNMNTSRWRAYYHGKKLHDESNSRLIDILLPRKDLFVTPLLVILNLVVFIIMAVSSLSLMNFEGQLLINWGANFSPNIESGEWWRLITSIFLHGGAFHLLFNLYALYMIGIILEPEIKSIRYIILYLLFGIVASLVSLSWNHDAVSVGASGAIFGMFGLYLALLFTNSISKELRAFASWVTGIAAISLLLGVMNSSIDNGAHIGGLITGFILGFLISPFIKNHSQDIQK
ncbi:MAG TPA: rhomboid family intramembrane serine protease [Kangiella sp.]